uniref:carboxypeptidase-like regulatory domain-containing protein n=2 Tax=Bacteroidota TaxID=976 RepID=UPI0016283082
MKFLQKYILLAVLLAVGLSLQAQNNKIVQVSGYILAEETDIAVPYVTIRNESYGNETYSANHEGYFSFVGHTGDEIVFSSIGYRSVRITIPNVEGDKYTVKIELTPTVEELPMVTVGPPLPWASIEEFNMEFLALNIGSDD